MKRRKPDDGRRLRRGYFAKCAWCGEMVVHARKNDEPFQMHARSKKCQEAGEKLRAAPPEDGAK